MSKNKEKHNVHESAEKKHPSSAGHAPAVDATPGAPEPNAAGVQPASPAPAEAAGQIEKIAQLHDRLLRLQADFDNFRKRTLREKNELFDSANQALMLELLPVLDHLHLGIQATSAHQAIPAFQEGLVLILDQFMVVLSKFGLNLITTENQVFDPNRFEAVNTLPSATEPEGKVLALVRSGYMLRNKLLRPAQVIVSSGPPPEQKPEDRRLTTDARQEKTKDGSQETDGGKE